jgi:hypothetical protein
MFNIHSAIQSPALCAVKRAGIVDDIGAGSFRHPAIINAAGAILLFPFGKQKDIISWRATRRQL